MKTIFASLLILFISGTLSAQQKTAATIAKNVDPKEFSRLMNAKPGLILDVRTPGEVEKGAIRGSRNIDFFSDNFSNEIDKLDKNKPVYVYCASGGRSGETMDLMKEKGFKEVYNLEGGYTAWKKSMPEK